LTQNYKNYELIVIDDCSTDATYGIIKTVHAKYGNFTIYRHEHRVGVSLVARIEGLKFISKKNEEYIIINIDGDDYLADSTVFSYLNGVYQDDNVYMTYGQYEPESHSYHNYCTQLHNTRMYRKSGKWVTSHIRTYRKKIFDIIRDEDLRDKNNNYYKVGDAAVMFPLVEMCGLKRIKFISKVLYVYNDLNTTCAMKIDPAKQIAEANEIRNKPEYAELLENI
jgi:glycosyltransferase involved in cell wall biosynthesis